MIADTLTITAIAAELKGLIGARIDRIYQPSRYEVLIYLYHGGEKNCLLLSTHPGRSRIHLTQQSYRHPEQPAPFCMLLRKYLSGGVILGISQPPLERIINFMVRSMEGIFTGDLIAEIMGRRSNLILVNRDRRILGALKNRNLERNRYRAIFPGETYLPPPVPDKLDPYNLNPEHLAETLTLRSLEGKSPEKTLLEQAQGISPLTATELVYRCRWNREQPEQSARRLVKELQMLFQNSREGHFEPCWALLENKYASYRLTHLVSPQESYSSMSEMLDDYYRHNIERENMSALRRTLQTSVQKKLSRSERKLAEQQQDLERAKDKEKLRLYGETLLTFARQVPPGTEQVDLPDPYHPEQLIRIPLDPRLIVSGNAQKYFRLYRKAKNTEQKADKQLVLTRSEVDYWQQLLNAIGKADYNQLLAIRLELEGSPQKAAATKKPEISLPLTFHSSGKNPILVGRNRHQNDLVTFKLSSRQDTWLHAREMPGSHVLIKDAPYPPPPDLLEEAALLAAYFSKGRESPVVEVDYTAVKFVRRTPGGKPGQVLYTNYQTITVRTDSERLRQLLSRNTGS